MLAERYPLSCKTSSALETLKEELLISHTFILT